MKRSWILRIGLFAAITILILVYYTNSFGNNSKPGVMDDVEMGSHGEDGSNKGGMALKSNPHDPRGHLKHKIVHLDLKGMPPLISYYEELFPFLKQLGVTGILIEYEDMFPYQGRLSVLANKSAYTLAEIRHLLDLAKANNLMVIPLIQTFGHMEFVLKLENYVGLREVLKYPQVICPSNNQSLELIKEMIDQVMSLHPNIGYLHIGSDEVYYIGMCPLCTDRMSKTGTDTVQLFLQHVKAVVKYVRDTFDIRPIMWDDEFRGLDEDVIASTGLGSLVDIVVWNYHPDVDQRLGPSLWAKYARVFDSIWIGSAFKGADMPNSMVVNETHYLANHYSWVRVMQQQESQITFQGVMLTGWQRYDHFSVLCEILPVAIPSLASCLAYLNTTVPVRMEAIFEHVSTVLSCGGRLNYCHFPGYTTHQEVKQLAKYQSVLQTKKKEHTFVGWASPMNLRLRFSSPSHVEAIFQDMNMLRVDLERLQGMLIKSLSEIFPKWSVDEWMLCNFDPTLDEVVKMTDGLNKILDQRVFPVRPLTEEPQASEL